MSESSTKNLNFSGHLAFEPHFAATHCASDHDNFCRARPNEAPAPRGIKHRIHRKVAQRLPEKKSPQPFAGQGLGRCRFSLLPLDGIGSAVPSFQLNPVVGAVSSRVPPNDAPSRFIGFGAKSWDNSKNFFQTQGFEFLFLSQRARRAAFGGSIAPKTPVLKLNRPLVCKPPAAIVSESTRVDCAPFAKPQVTGLRHRWAK